MQLITAIIKDIKKVGRLSQSDIQRLTGLHQTKVSRWEAGMVPFAAQDVFKLLHLADELGIPTTQYIRKK